MIPALYHRFEDSHNCKFLAMNHVAIPCTPQAQGDRDTSPVRYGDSENARPLSLLFIKKRRGNAKPGYMYGSCGWVTVQGCRECGWMGWWMRGVGVEDVGRG